MPPNAARTTIVVARDDDDDDEDGGATRDGDGDEEDDDDAARDDDVGPRPARSARQSGERVVEMACDMTRRASRSASSSDEDDR